MHLTGRTAASGQSNGMIARVGRPLNGCQRGWGAHCARLSLSCSESRAPPGEGLRSDGTGVPVERCGELVWSWQVRPLALHT